MRTHLRSAAALLLFALSTGSHCVRAQCKSQDSQTAASPSQPLVTDSPETIAPGILELETGWAQAWPGAGTRHSSVGVMVKLGVFCNFEFRNYFGGWQSQSGPGSWSANGNGDDWVTGQYRFMRESGLLPSAAIHYTLKIPMAGVQDGLGSGAMDHIVAISAGKTVKRTAFTWEAKWILLGQPQRGGFNRYDEYSANFTRSLARRVAITGEFYGDTKSSALSPAFGSSLWSLAYSVNPRLVFDAGIDVGFTHGAPCKRFFSGVTYAVGDLYHSNRSRRPEETRLQPSPTPSQSANARD